ncbi:MAG: PQQ-dependent sugar dehydrogenase [Acidobacteria bacterium]|nr:PQQ-dependent sugar dehydrogenase [Acidobacteriota bacterium]
MSKAAISTFLLALLLLAPISRADDTVLSPKLIAGGLDMPIGIFNAGDERMFFILQQGQIVIWDGTKMLSTPFLDLRPFRLVSCCGERGLLGLAFHPHFAENGLFFITYVDARGDIALVRYKVLDSNPNVADLSTAKPILTILHREFTNHYSGNIVFGPDGYLYMGTGDGGSAGDPLNNAQSLSRLLGKILRLDVDTLPGPYTVPPTNPFVGRFGAEEEVWAYGLRNPWRFTFDRDTGDLIIGDVGQSSWEEVDFQPASSKGGENYGWRVKEGLHCYPPSLETCLSDSVQPILEYTHVTGDCSITGGYRYRGTKSPNMLGVYFYGDYCSGKIWGAREQSDGKWFSKLLLQTDFSITAFGQDAAGELYVADHGGAIYKLVDETAPTPTTEPRRRRALR